jgi:4-amino-4-deoxy-L-arabinose transferase-like glycosyltransferase
MSKNTKHETRFVMLALGVILAVFFLTAASSKLFDRDEPRFARATVEMVRSGNYLVPTFNGELRPDKPILIYWLTSLTMKLMGQTELAFRFFAPLGVAGTCLLTYLLGRRFFGLKAGFLAMIMIPTTPLVLMVGTAATTDAVLLVFISLSVFIFFQTYPGRLSWSRTLLLGLMLGTAMLTKGPVGLAVPVLTIITVTFFFRRKKLPFESIFWRLLTACAVGLILFCLWAVPANEATGGEFLSRGLGHHVGSRMVTSFESHGGNFLLYLPFYLVVIILGFFPWTLYLPSGLSASFGGRLGKETISPCLLGWILPTFLLMTMVITKLPHYILPIWPALALVSAGIIRGYEQKALNKRDLKWLKRGPWFFVPIGLLLSLGLMVFPWFSSLNKVRGPIFASGLILLVMVILGMRQFKRRRHWSCGAILAGGMILFQINTALFVLPSLNRFKVSPNIARQVRAVTPEQVKVFMYRFNEPSLIFYLDRPGVEQLSSPENVLAWADREGRAVLIIPRPILNEIERDYRALGLKEIGRATGFSLGHGEWLELLALERH